MRALVCLALLALPALVHAGPRVEKGTFRFTAADNAKDVPARYQVKPRSFSYELERKTAIPSLDVTVYKLRFPSPIKSGTPENNTVHAEYYLPDGKGPFPAVIVLG